MLYLCHLPIVPGRNEDRNKNGGERLICNVTIMRNKRNPKTKYDF